MACFWLNQNETNITVPETEDRNGIFFYKIIVTVGDINWAVWHRYSEFYEMHQILVVDHGVSRDILPPKKILYYKTPAIVSSFVEERRKKLELYLQNICNYFKRTMPRIYVTFLKFPLYDIFFQLQDMAFLFYSEADSLLSSSKSYSLNPFQLHSISECLKKPFPKVEENDERFSFSHVLDFCLQLNNLQVSACETELGETNLSPNQLRFELSCFKSLKALKINGIGLEYLYEVGSLRSCLLHFYVHNTNIHQISEALQCDVLHKSIIEKNQIWTKIAEIDFSDNCLVQIDESIKLVPSVRTLKFDRNKITSIPDLTCLPHLTYLSISDNCISECNNLHRKLGNLGYLNLSQNNITSLKGFSKLYSLETLDLSCNRISDVEETSYLSQLQCLENLVLTGNSLATIVDYRTKLLEHLSSRAQYICLDNEKPTQQELDKASLLRALRILNEGKNSNNQEVCKKINSFVL